MFRSLMILTLIAWTVQVPPSLADSPAPLAKAKALRTTAAPLAKTSAPAVTARVPASMMGVRNTNDITEELKIMGQSRNLSMGLLFQKGKDKLTFGTPRTNYQDKVSDKKSNF